MKNSYIKALRREKEAKTISIGYSINWWMKGFRGTFNEALYLEIAKIKAK